MNEKKEVTPALDQRGTKWSGRVKMRTRGIVLLRLLVQGEAGRLPRGLPHLSSCRVGAGFSLLLARHGL